MTYVEPRRVLPFVAYASWISLAILFAAAALLGVVFFPNALPLTSPYGVAGLLTAFSLAAWTVATWPSTRASRLRARPVTVDSGRIIFPISPLRSASSAPRLTLGSVGYFISNVAVGDGLLHLVFIDAQGDRHDRTYLEDTGGTVYAATVLALSRVAEVSNAAAESDRAQKADFPADRKAIIGSVAAPLCVVLVSSLLVSPLTLGGMLLSLMAGFITATMVSAPLLRVRRRWRLNHILDDVAHGKSTPV